MVTIRIKKVSKINIVLGAMIAAASGASRFNQQLKWKGLKMSFLGKISKLTLSVDKE